MGEIEDIAVGYKGVQLVTISRPTVYGNQVKIYEKENEDIP